mgnify:CR=1 FL=1
MGFRSRKAVSEIVSSIILTVIVVVIGTSLIAYSAYMYFSTRNTLMEHVNRVENELRQSISALIAYGNKGENRITIILVAGEYGVKISNIYINGTAINYSAQLSSYEVRVIEVSGSDIGIDLSQAPPESILGVLVLYEGGELYVYAPII